MPGDPRLIVALDVPNRALASAMVERLGDAVSFYKIGLELFASDGMALARDLKAAGHKVFLDWKLHDIGATVEKAATVLADSRCDLLTVHAHPQVMRAAVRATAGSGLKVLGVTVLTSLSNEDLVEMGYGFSARELVERRIRQAVDCGVAGVVASPHEAALAGTLAPKDFLVVTPGVRPSGTDKNDQARAATPSEAIRAGATHLVCGRPITAALDPRSAALAIAEEIRASSSVDYQPLP